MALLHWGSEFNDDISKTQKSIVSLMQKQGVDVIIGTHPHTLQPIVFDEDAGTLVAYSLGDFFGEADRGATNYSIILNLKDTYWSVLLPGAISAYNMMIVKNFFQGIPQELEESASMDGCTDVGILWKIVLPLSLPVLATFGLFYAVGHWNAYFGAMIYMSGAREKWPLQVLLREIIILSNASAGDLNNMDPEFIQPPEQSVKMAVIVVSTVPIMCVYPFLQKYFVKGVMVGALKG